MTPTEQMRAALTAALPTLDYIYKHVAVIPELAHAIGSVLHQIDAALALPDDRATLVQALADATKAENSNARRMREAVVEARRRLAKGRTLWNGPCHECDAVLAQALTVNNDMAALTATSSAAEWSNLADAALALPAGEEPVRVTLPSPTPEQEAYLNELQARGTPTPERLQQRVGGPRPTPTAVSDEAVERLRAALKDMLSVTDVGEHDSYAIYRACERARAALQAAAGEEGK